MEIDNLNSRDASYSKLSPLQCCMIIKKVQSANLFFKYYQNVPAGISLKIKSLKSS